MTFKAIFSNMGQVCLAGSRLSSCRSESGSNPPGSSESPDDLGSAAV